MSRIEKTDPRGGKRTRSRSQRPRSTAVRRSDGNESTQVHGLYIQDAAEMVGANATALRMWEQQGLVRPARTKSGYRSYSAGDIDRLRHIQSLVSAGVNAAGIRRIIQDSVTEAGATTATGEERRAHAPAVGQTLRALRGREGLTLRALAERTGLSPSYLTRWSARRRHRRSPRCRGSPQPSTPTC